jgi:hypothetical protein
MSSTFCMTDQVFGAYLGAQAGFGAVQAGVSA